MPDTLEVGAIDPNFVPPTRPPSALSTNSDTSYFALYAESESEQVDPKNAPPEYLPRRIVVETIRRHGWECLLCGREDDLTVVRAVLQHGIKSTDQDVRCPDASWLRIRLILVLRFHVIHPADLVAEVLRPSSSRVWTR